MGVIALIVGVLLVGLAISTVQSQSDRTDIQRWATAQGYQIDEIEKTWFDSGPYWFRGKGRRIYRCRVRDSQGQSRTVYMRTRFFGNDYEFFEP